MLWEQGGSTGLGEGGGAKGAQDFPVGESTLDTRMVGTSPYTFVQAHRVYNARSEPSCKLRTLGGNDVFMYVCQL